MRKFLTVFLIFVLIALTVFGFLLMDYNTKKVSGYFSDNVIFHFDKDENNITFLNKKINFGEK